MKNTSKLVFGRHPYNISNFFSQYSSNQVNIKLNTENQPSSLLNSGIRYEEYLKISIWKTTIFFSIFLLVRLKLNDIVKISLLACLILDIAMTKTLHLVFGRRPEDNSIFFSIIFLFRLISSYLPKVSLLACLILEIAVKKTLKLRFGRRPHI